MKLLLAIKPVCMNSLVGLKHRIYKNKHVSTHSCRVAQLSHTHAGVFKEWSSVGIRQELWTEVFPLLGKLLFGRNLTNMKFISHYAVLSAALF